MDTKEKTRSPQPSGSKASGRNHPKDRQRVRKKATNQAPSKQRTEKVKQEKRPRLTAEQVRERRIEEGRRRSAERSQRRRHEKMTTRKPRTEVPEVIYTPPKPFNSAAFLLRLATVVAVVIAFVFAISIFFKVKTVNVSGTEKYTPWAVMQASGIKEGDNLLTLAKAKVSGRITAQLPYVASVRVEIQLPDTVNIEITELDVVYAAQDEQNRWWLLTAEGKIMEQIHETDAKNHTQILGVQLLQPAENQQAVAMDTADDTVTRGSDRLSAAKTILQNLELHGIFGEVDSINVENLGAIELWYDQQYHVKLGDTSRLEYKISCMNTAVKQMDDYRSGTLDISFTTWPDQIGYTPFNEE